MGFTLPGPFGRLPLCPALLNCVAFPQRKGSPSPLKKQEVSVSGCSAFPGSHITAPELMTKSASKISIHPSLHFRRPFSKSTPARCYCLGPALEISIRVSACQLDSPRPPEGNWILPAHVHCLLFVPDLSSVMPVLWLYVNRDVPGTSSLTLTRVFSQWK